MSKIRRRFRPSLLPGVLVIVMLMVLISLGTWQLNRSAEKQRLIDSYRQAPSLPVISPAELTINWQEYRYRKIDLTGQYLADRQILMENQIRGHQPGFLVLTPFKLQGGEGIVLVNRGWLAEMPDNQHIERIALSGETQVISGLVNHPPGVGMRMGSLDDSSPGWPKRLPYIDMQWLGLQLADRIKPWMVLLGDDEPDGFDRQWQPTLRMNPEKHQGYALQWYSLAIALVFLFVAGSMRPEGDDRATEDDSDTQRPD